MNIGELILIGLVVGLIGRLIVPGRQPLGIIGTIAAGIAGSLLGWWIGRRVAGVRVAQHPWLWAIAGAVIVVAIVAAAMRQSHGRRVL